MPEFSVDRHWNISEDERPGTVIDQVQAIDKDPDAVITFGLDVFIVYPDTWPYGTVTNKTLPFRIDPKSGIIRLNESLEGRGGQTFHLWVMVIGSFWRERILVYVCIMPNKERLTKEN